jgi:hypothetical protein
MNDQTTKKTSLLSASKQQKLSDTSVSSPIIVPTPSITSEPDDLALRDKSRMESSQDQIEDQAVEEAHNLGEQEQLLSTPPGEDIKVEFVVARKKIRGEKKAKHPVKKSKRVIIESSESEFSEGSDSESESSSEDGRSKRKRKQKLAARRAAAKKKQRAKLRAKKYKSKSKSKKYESSSADTSSSDSSFDSEHEVFKPDKKSRRKAIKAKANKKRSKKADISSDDDSDSLSSSLSSSSSDSESGGEQSKSTRAKAKRRSRKSKVVEASSTEQSSGEEDAAVPPPDIPIDAPIPSSDLDSQIVHVSNVLQSLQAQKTAASATVIVTKLDKPVKKNALEFKRVDQVYDMKIRDWKLVESSNDAKDEFDCVFTVRRRLNWEGKYQDTQVDIKSKILRNCLQEVFKECKSISLVEDTPQLDPHTLFHYYDEIKVHVKKELKTKLKRAKKSKEKKLRTHQIAQCKLLLKYLDEDYTSVRRALKPMLKAGTITYDLVWALFKPNTIAFTPTYANKDDPRCFRVDFSYEYESWLTQAKSLVVDGRYLEYDGKTFGLGDHQVQIQAFKGHKKITSLSVYPLKYHKDPEVSSD